MKAAIDICVISFTSLIAYFTIDQLGHLSALSDLQRRVVAPLLGAIGQLRDGIYTKVTDIPWTQLFKDSKKIYLVVQGWDGWIAGVASELRPFLKSGGMLHVVLPALPALGVTEGNRARNLVIAAERTGVSVEAQREEIEETVRSLETFVVEAIGRSKSAKQLVVSYTEQTNWFCGMYFEPHSLLISVYQHKHRGVKIFATVVPSFVVRISQFPTLRDWFATEWEHLTGDSPW